MKWRLFCLTGITCVAWAGVATAATVTPTWAQYQVAAKAGTCSGLPKQFAVSRDGQSLAYQAPGQYWQWQLTKQSGVSQARFWASDLKAGVRFVDALELAAVPAPAEFLRVLQAPSKAYHLACGGIAKPIKHWQAAWPVIDEAALIDQTDLADMEGNATAVALSHRLPMVHRH